MNGFMTKNDKHVSLQSEYYQAHMSVNMEVSIRSPVQWIVFVINGEKFPYENT